MSPGEMDEWFNLLDLDAIALPSDKLDECRFFFALLEKETDPQRFRWLISAFFSAAYSYFEIVALHAYESFSDPETGESVPDQEALEVLRRYVVVVRDENRRFYVKTAGRHRITKQLYELRKKNTHHTALAIMKTTDDLPAGFEFGFKKGQGRPALSFCRDVMSLIEKVTKELQPHLLDF